MAASAIYLERRGTPMHPKDLPAHDCLGLSYWRHRDQWHLFGPDGEWRSDVSGRLSADNGDALRVAALNGAGIVLQPEVMLADDLARGRLVQVLPEWTPVASPMYLLYAVDRRPTAKLRSMIDFLLKRFGTSAE